MYKRYILAVLAGLAFAVLGCDDDSDSNEQKNPTCVGDNCEQECTGDSCEQECTGDSCEQECTGDNCEQECTGDNCEQECTGDSCEQECTGDNCEPECVGDSCEEDTETTYPDADGDTISDKNEGWNKDPAKCVDTDGDTTPDYLDLDSDNDTLPDSVEALNKGNPANATKRCGYNQIPAFRSVDADLNGIPDADEVQFDADGNPLDSDGDTLPDFCDDDNDGDLIADEDEIVGKGRDCDGDTIADELGTAENPVDCDGDTLPDYMDIDSDGDSVEDVYEGIYDSNGDGFFDRYSQDSDGDGHLDREERGNGTEPLDSDDDGRYDFRDQDSDNDGLLDINEIVCTAIGVDSRVVVDADGDGESDLAEYAVEQSKNLTTGTLICDNTQGVKEYGITFYFELPSTGEEKTELLGFEPQVSKADIVFNFDHSGNMSDTTEAIKGAFADIANFIQKRVKDVQFGLSIFGHKNNTDYKLLSPVTDATSFQNVFNTETLTWNKTTSSTDNAGYYSLYQIATQSATGFRSGSIPIIVHVTPYKSLTDYNNITETKAVEALNAKGARVVILDVLTGDPSEEQSALYDSLARLTKSTVPYCAYSISNNDKIKWICGENKCCTNNFFAQAQSYNQVGVDPVENMCILNLETSNTAKSYTAYDGNSYNGMSYEIMLAIENIVKYGTYDVAVQIIGEPLLDSERAGTATDTTCFIQKVEADEYILPSDPAQAACLSTVKPEPAKFNGSSYNNGFENFAVGTADPEGPKASVRFKVTAKNDNCVKTSETARSYNATLQVYNPTTNAVFAEHKVAIIVPGYVEEVEIIN